MKKGPLFYSLIIGNILFICTGLIFSLLHYINIVTLYIIVVCVYEFIICPFYILLSYFIDMFRFSLMYLLPFYLILCLFPLPYQGYKNFKFFGINVYKLYYKIKDSTFYLYFIFYFNLYSNFILISINFLFLFFLLYNFIFDKIFLFLFFLLFYIIFLISLKIKYSKIKIFEYKYFNISLNFLLIIISGFYLNLIIDTLKPIFHISNIDIFSFI